MSKSNLSRHVLLLACLGAILGIISDCLLLWSPTSLFDIKQLDYLGEMSAENMKIGNYLGVSAIPLEFLAIFAFVKPGKQFGRGQLLLVVIALYMLVFGLLFHAHLLVQHEFTASDTILPMTLQAMEFYKAIVGVAFTAAGLLIVIGIYKQWVKLPKWAILLSPICTYLLWLILDIIYPPVGNVLLLAGLNLSFLIFFSLCLLFPNSYD